MRQRHIEINQFAQRIEFSKSGCWNWIGTLSNGYGAFTVQGKSTTAHLFSYKYFIGEVPLGLQLDHTCNNRRCCNPFHLEPVTKIENARRRRGIPYHSWKIRLQLSPERFKAEFPNCDPETGNYLRVW